MSDAHQPDEAIGRVTHWFGHVSVAAVSLTSPLTVGDRIHIRGHTTDLIETVRSMEIEHQKVDRAGPGDDVAFECEGRVHEHEP
jgi:putative protease